MGVQTSDFKSQMKEVEPFKLSAETCRRTSTTTVEVQADMGARMDALDFESQVNPNSAINVEQQADMGVQIASSDVESQLNLNSVSYVETEGMESNKLSVETPRRTSVQQYSSTLRNNFIGTEQINVGVQTSDIEPQVNPDSVKNAEAMEMELNKLSANQSSFRRRTSSKFKALKNKFRLAKRDP